ncbi:hypothetical protein [Streptomyces sp. JJ36]|uniref:hypothetical protein n=1 Tax=Streptomyces sp. JJ36 TaxID=2736645 RepID=UPI001F417FCE|nr:hypothetical protein [Streptomyces sp. JJ36]MCF6524134.1 hypothetical protein [Streptomyces sp. JJ36]
MPAEERKRPRAGQQASPSMSELLASCAAADAVSRPPSVPEPVPAAGPPEEPHGATEPSVGRDAA